MTLKKKPSSFEAEIGKLAILVNKKEWDKAKDLAWTVKGLESKAH